MAPDGLPTRQTVFEGSRPRYGCLPRPVRLDRLAGGRHAIFQLAFAGGAVGVAMIFYHFVVTIGGHFREVERGLELPSPGFQLPIESIPPENRFVIRIHGARASGRSKPTITVNDREMKGWPEVAVALCRAKEGGPFGGYTVLIVPDDEAPFGCFARVLGLLEGLQFRLIQVRFADELEPKR